VCADERLVDEFPSVRLPPLILHGTDDKATVSRGSQFPDDIAGSTDKALELYEGHCHDLLNDAGKEWVMADIRQRIEASIHVRSLVIRPIPRPLTTMAANPAASALNP